MFEPKFAIKDLKPCIENKDNKTGWRLKLNENENIYGTSKFAISTLRNIDLEEIGHYPDYDIYADKFAKLYNQSKENILLVNGIHEAISLIINTYLEKDDEFLSQNPTDNKVFSYVQSVGAKINYTDFENRDLNFDIEKLKAKITGNTKICYISTPNKVTGQIIRASNIINLVKEYPNILFIIDVSYVNFAQNIDVKDYTDIINNFSNAIIIKSFAIDYALAGLGLGVMLSKKQNIENLEILKQNNSVSIASLKCAISAINDMDYFEKIKEENIETKEFLHNEFLKFGFKPYESGANFILCDFGNYSEFYYNKFKNNGIIVKNYNEDSFKNCLRITVPKLSGAKFILQLLKKKDIIVFAFEETLFDIKNSYSKALLKTFEQFAGCYISSEKIKETRLFYNYSSFEAIQKLLLDRAININLKDIIYIFKNIFHDPDNCLIDKDELLITKDILEQLSLFYDLVIISDRLKDDVLYALKKYNIEKYFSYIKSNVGEISDIIINCPNTTISVFGSNEETISSAKRANIKSIGLITKENNDPAIINNFKHFGTDDIIYGNNNILKYFKAEI